MKGVYSRIWIVLLCGLLLLGCGGGEDSNFSYPKKGYTQAGDTISVPSGVACSLVFVSATPGTIALKGTGGPSRSEISNLVFMVVDKDGNPVANEIVQFSLSTEVGGLSLSRSTDISDAQGLARVSVISGNVSTEVKVQAVLEGNHSVVIVSDVLIVSTGLPDQDSISIAAETFNPEAWNYNNVEVEIIFQASDIFNNFVPDGTMVYFTTEGGSINASVETKDGIAKATWRSSNPRPEDGRVTILAFCIGEESFIDRNSNGLFDEADVFKTETDLGEPFRDDNESYSYDDIEPYWDFNCNEEFDSEPNGIYNGTLCSESAQASGKCTRELVYVQASIVLTMSGSHAVISFTPDPVDLTGQNSQIVSISVGDLNNNPMPNGTTIEVESNNGTIIGDHSFEVPNTYQAGPLVYQVLLAPSRNDLNSGYLTVKVSTPLDVKSAASVLVLDNPSPTGVACSLEFVSASTKTIALKGTGGPPRSEISNLVFRVVDEDGNPIDNEIVRFSLSTGVGGLSLSRSTDISDAQGFVRVSVISGNVSTEVKVQAELEDDPTVVVVSDTLIVSTGLPDQDSISIGAATLNPEAWHFNNVEVEIIFQAADIFNNFVPDGTMVYFTTEGGSINASVETKDGVAKATWRSANPRPEDGRVTILAFCIGEESFIDRNSNGLFDETDLLKTETDLGEPFRDDNENNSYDDTDPYWDFNSNGEFDSEPNGIYNGTLCSESAQAIGLCTRELVYVQASIVLIMSGSQAIINFTPDAVDLTGQNMQNVLITLADLHNNPMPSGTTVEVEASNGKIIGKDSFEVPDTNHSGPSAFQVVLVPSENDRTAGYLTVHVTTPFGVESAASILVLDND